MGITFRTHRTVLMRTFYSLVICTNNEKNGAQKRSLSESPALLFVRRSVCGANTNIDGHECGKTNVSGIFQPQSMNVRSTSIRALACSTSQFAWWNLLRCTSSCHLCTSEFNATFYLIIFGRMMMPLVGIAGVDVDVVILLMMGLWVWWTCLSKTGSHTQIRFRTNGTMRACIVIDVCVCFWVLCG